ncbi:Alpha/Beta hydrolase protein [Kockiozyma suomiensis]|uniref:Alpha/Beta hydrolase protein n=1 Tax=Kockiozyma suomiensis TaxID=1337062 RepID=UPI003342EDC7
MSPRLPEDADFSGTATVTITPSQPPGSTPSHALILLHGLGDTIAPFSALANRLNLPKAAVIALQAPMPMPFELGGYHWGDDLVFSKDPLSPSSSSADDEVLSPDAEFTRSGQFLKTVIHDVLEMRCGFTASKNVILFGYGQGGMAALYMAATKMNLCAVISVGGWIPSAVRPREILDLPRSTSVLLCGGDQGSAITEARLKYAEELFKECRRVVLPRMKGDLMPRNKDEMAPILRFLLRILVPEALAQQGFS